MKTNSVLSLMILLCCLPGPQVILGFQEVQEEQEQEPEEQKEVVGEKVEDNADAGNPVIADPPVRDRDKDPPDGKDDYEKAGGYEDQNEKEKEGGQLEAVLVKEDEEEIQVSVKYKECVDVVLQEYDVSRQVCELRYIALC